ncbi:glycosyltransferase [Geobacillus zalihae]|uniref:glycosyltransferase n=1 Tax=Geobacillus zalihae TaxID=213419 RepID=UPI00260C05B2|nr:glycosyltransferase [Geobacillus zalihae]WKA47195.1 glycosyltransferase [Geobacillus zalihae]
MNIWILTSEFPPSFGGGIGMYVDQASTMFSERGHKVTVLVRDDHKDSIEYPNENLRVIRFKHMEGEFYSYLGYWTALAYQYAEELAKFIVKFGEAPDIIEIQDYNAIGYYILQKKWLKDPIFKDIPIVLHLHTPTFELDKINQAPRYKFPNYWIGQMEKFCIKAVDALLSPSHFLKEKLQGLVPEKDIKVINLPYDLKDYREGYQRNFDSDTFLYIGRTEYRKGVLQMIKGAENLWKKGYEFKLKIIGGDTYFYPRSRMLGDYLKEKYEHRIKEGKLIFKNAVPPKELNPEILNARAVIVPSLYENFPYTCLTSMWLGAPMLVSASGGQAEMVGENGVCGLIFNWEIEGDFEDKLRQLIEMDKSQLQEMSLNSEKRIRSLCNVEKNLEERIKFFEDIIHESKMKNKDSFPTLLDIPKQELKHKVTYVKGKLSIIIPFYNLGKFLNETLNSALNSTYPHKEIIIVNDGSTDEMSLNLLEEIRKKDNPIIKIIDLKNKGLANARNVGAMNAEGEFITFLDADDLVDPSFYAKAIDILNTYQNVSFVYSWLEYFGESKGVWATFNAEFPYLLCQNMLSAFAVVRKEDFINFGLNKIELEYGLEDYEGWLSMCANGCVGISIPETLVKYRVRKDSMARQFNPDMLKYLRSIISDRNPEIYQKYAVEIFNLLDANGPGFKWNNPSFDSPESVISENTYEGNLQKNELLRIANSKLGKFIIKAMFKLKLNKLFK